MDCAPPAYAMHFTLGWGYTRASWPAQNSIPIVVSQQRKNGHASRSRGQGSGYTLTTHHCVKFGEHRLAVLFQGDEGALVAHLIAEPKTANPHRAQSANSPPSPKPMQITINSSMYINNISQWQRVKTGQSCVNVCWPRGCDYLPFSIEHQPQWAAFTQHCAPNCSIDTFNLECWPSLMKVHIEFGQRHNSCSPPLLLSSSPPLISSSSSLLLCALLGAHLRSERERREQRAERTQPGFIFPN